MIQDLQSIYLWSVLGKIVINKVQVLRCTNRFKICRIYRKIRWNAYNYTEMLFTLVSLVSNKYLFFMVVDFFHKICTFINHLLLKASQYHPVCRLNRYTPVSKLNPQHCFVCLPLCACLDVSFRQRRERLPYKWTKEVKYMWQAFVSAPLRLFIIY